MKKIISLFVLVACFSIAAFADIARPEKTSKPKPNKAIDADLTIRISRDATEARLIIPKSQIKQLRAELEQLDEGSDTTAALSFTRTQTIVSGMFLSLALVFGGVWFSRSRKPDAKTGKALIAGAVLLISGASAVLVFGNAGPPPAARSITSKLFNKDVFMPYNFAYGKIKIETSNDEGANLMLIVPEVPDEKKLDEKK